MSNHKIFIKCLAESIKAAAVNGVIKVKFAGFKGSKEVNYIVGATAGYDFGFDMTDLMEAAMISPVTIEFA